VTITAAVDRILSKSAFSVDQRRVGGVAAPPKPTDVLVLVPTLQSPVDLKSYVTVMGELVRFDPAEIAKKARTTRSICRRMWLRTTWAGRR